MKPKLIVIGIDSLDPYVLIKNKNILPTFSNLIDNSPTLISKSVFPTDTIPAWASIYTGLHPGNHGILYTYDVFDPNLCDLKKLDLDRIMGKAFWDYIGRIGYKSLIINPMLIYPSKLENGIMISKSPFDKRIDWIKSEIDVDVYPNSLRNKYEIPSKIFSLWGGFPGLNHLQEWSELGKQILSQECSLGIKLIKEESCDLFFMYYSILDIMQHRLWRFFDQNDPEYKRNNFNSIIFDYYKIFDTIISDFIQIFPNATLMVISDHGHRSRPIRTLNVNEILRRERYLTTKGFQKKILNLLRNTILKVTYSLNIEQWLLKIVVKNKCITRSSKSLYSSAGSIDRANSIAFLSNFAGIKSYSFGGIEINNKLLTKKEYEDVRLNLIIELSKLKTKQGNTIFNWIKRREELYPGRYNAEIFPNIIFELNDNYGIGWEIFSPLFSKSYDHKVAPGCHRKDAVLLIRNPKSSINKKDISIIDIAPTILDIFGFNSKVLNLDGVSLFD